LSDKVDYAFIGLFLTRFVCIISFFLHIFAFRDKMQTFLQEHESHVDLPQIEPDSGQTIFEFVPDASGMSNYFISFCLCSFDMQQQ